MINDDIKGATILVVDDDPTNLNVLFDYLTTFGFTVLLIEDGESALELLERKKSVDIILLDIIMPGDLDGFDTCSRLKENNDTKNIPVIFMSALSDTVGKVKGFELGAVDYITKPFQYEEVLARVKAHLTIQNLKRDLQEKNIELQKALKKAEELNELKSRFISIASHEIRSPITTILVTSEMLECYLTQLSDMTKADHFALIKEAIEQINEILDEILLTFKIEAGKIKFDPQPINLDLVCYQITEKFRRIGEETHIINFICEAKCDQFLADEKLLRHIFTNLLSNAIKYSPVGSTVCFEFKYENEQAIFIIKDEGIGIPEEDQKYLFEAFHRAKNVGQIKGTGLGLSIVRQFVELHDGKVSVNSKVGEGTTFTVTIPSK